MKKRVIFWILKGSSTLMPDLSTSLCHVSARSSLGQKVLGDEVLVAPLPHLPRSFLLLEGLERKVDRVKKKTGGQRKKELGNNVANVAEVTQSVDVTEDSGIPKMWQKMWQNVAGYGRTAEDFERFAEELAGCGTIAVDCETYNTEDPKLAVQAYANGSGLRLLTLAGRVGGEVKVWVCDLMKAGYNIGSLRDVLESRQLVLFNAAFDLGFLKRFCGLRATQVFDCQLAEQILRNGKAESDKKGYFGLAATLNRWFGITLDKTEQAGPWANEELTEAQIAYAAEDVLHLLSLAPKQIEELEASELAKVANLENRLVLVLVQMFADGIRLDVDGLNQRIAELEQASAKAWEAVLDEFKANGISQRFRFGQKGLFLDALRRLGLDINATDKITLAMERKKEGCPKVLELVAEFSRQASELTKSKEYVRLVCPDGRLRTKFKQMGAETGRLSSKQPALQNAPKKGLLRSFFVAGGPDRSLVVADYKTMEVTAAAIITGEDELLNDIRQGRDIHRKTAGIVFNKDETDVTPTDRDYGKLANLSLQYGGRARMLLNRSALDPNLRLTLEELEVLVSRWLASRPQMVRWQRQFSGVGEDNPVAVRTLLGRRRLEVFSYTEALNLPIQGSCADAMKLAMCWFAEAVEGRDVKLCLSVHDELVCDCPTNVAEQTGKLMEAVMVKAFKRIFGSHAPVGAEVGIGRSWAEAKKAVK